MCSVTCFTIAQFLFSVWLFFAQLSKIYNITETKEFVKCVHLFVNFPLYDISMRAVYVLKFDVFLERQTRIFLKQLGADVLYTREALPWLSCTHISAYFCTMCICCSSCPTHVPTLPVYGASTSQRMQRDFIFHIQYVLVQHPFSSSVKSCFVYRVVEHNSFSYFGAALVDQ